MKLSAKTTILVIEDSNVERTMIKQILNKKGFSNVLTANDGEEGLNMLRDPNNKVEVCIVDWNMPRMTGIDLLKEIKGDSKLSRIPFIMATSNKDKESVIEAIGEGVHEYLLKPFTPNDLFQKIVHAIKVAASAKD